MKSCKCCLFISLVLIIALGICGYIFRDLITNELSKQYDKHWNAIDYSDIAEKINETDDYTINHYPNYDDADESDEITTSSMKTKIDYNETIEDEYDDLEDLTTKISTTQSTTTSTTVFTTESSTTVSTTEPTTTSTTSETTALPPRMGAPPMLEPSGVPMQFPSATTDHSIFEGSGSGSDSDTHSVKSTVKSPTLSDDEDYDEYKDVFGSGY